MKANKARLLLLEPEVAGGWGQRTVLAENRDVGSEMIAVPEVEFLEYRFDGWLGDDLVAFLSTYIVTERLADLLRANTLSGYRLAEISMQRSDMWEQLHPDRLSPTFLHLVLEGNVSYSIDKAVTGWSGDDICLGRCLDWKQPVTPAEVLVGIPPYAMVVSDKAYQVMKQLNIYNCETIELQFT